jgi:CHAT domain-containing protein
VRERLDGSAHLLVIPDGPLHLVPFAALVERDGPRPIFLVERRRVSRAMSLTLMAAASAQAPPVEPRAVVAFGDPLAPGEGAGAPRLPHARTEVRELARLFGAGTRVFVGSEATEARARALAPEAGYLHFAGHAQADDRFPHDTYLALASSPGPDGPDGRLQAREICGQLRLKSALVVLSGCETAAGPELGGAGLLGLTYAFRLAGARTVVASLWPVSDRSTATLMRAFYSRLRSGLGPEEALRGAQAGMIEGPVAAEGGWASAARRLLRRPGPADEELDASHPYYWAAFQVFRFAPATLEQGAPAVSVTATR